MEVGLIAVIVVALLVALLAIRTPVAFALLAAGAVGLLLLDGPRVAMASLGREPYDTIAHYSLVVVPLYTALGFFAQHAGIAERAFVVMHRRLRRIRGSLALATLGAAAGFGSISGSSVGTAAVLGKLTMDQLPKHGYDRAFSAALIAVTSSLGILIPPSIVLVLYGMMTGESIAELTIAALIPSVVTIAFYAGYIVWKGWRSPELYGIDPRAERLGRRLRDTEDDVERLGLRAEAWVYVELVVLLAVVIGGVFLGWLTITESAGLGALAAALMLLWDRRRDGGRALLRLVGASLVDTVKMTGLIVTLMIGAGVFATFVVRARIPQDFSEWAIGLGLPAMLLAALLLALLVPLGMFLDGMSLLLIMTPMYYVVITDLGYSGIWLGIMMIKLIELGMITPPVGLNVFVVSGVSKTPVGLIFRGVTPFFFLELAVIVTLFLLPGLTDLLPGVMQR